MATQLEQSKTSEIKKDILQEAVKSHRQVLKLKDSVGEFVKIKRAYVEPESLRELYLSAVKELVLDGSLRLALANEDLQMYEVGEVEVETDLTVDQAKEELCKQLMTTGYLYKVHSDKGEFVQCGKIDHKQYEQDRILYLSAFCQLVHHGVVQLITETHDLATYRLVDSKNGVLNEEAAR